MNKFYFLLLSVVGVLCFGQNYSGGAGTINNPYKISTLDDLKYLSEHSSELGKNFLQIADIDASATSTWDFGKGFYTIGGSYSFYGTYDGGGYKIIGMVVNRSSNMYGGMFAALSTSGTLKNIHLVGGSFYADMYVGSLAGETNGTVINCSSSATVKASKYGGGLIAIVKGGITNCHATGNVEAGSTAGGLASSAGGGVISNCYATGKVSGGGASGGLLGGSADKVINCYATGNVSGDSAGGLIGNSSYLVSDCYATGNVNGTQAGGLIGWMFDSVTRSYATGNVTSYSFGGGTAGGLVGYAGHGFASGSFSGISLSYATGTVGGAGVKGGLLGQSNTRQIISISNSYSRSNMPDGGDGLVGFFAQSGSSITNSYATGQLGGNTANGGLIGLGRGTTYSKAYWDYETTGSQVADASNWTSTDGARTTQAMKTQSTFVNWDFVNVWSINPLINDGYPYLNPNSGTLSANEVAVKPVVEVKIHPVPADNQIYISSDTAVLKYTIFDMQGRLLNEGSPNSKNFNVVIDFLSKGTYLINLVYSKGNDSRKFIKN
nr:T9SS type A sorting domain-containing protein [uncultured Chryseobacterium sp.]